MTTRDELLALAARVEAAGASAELDAEIAFATGWQFRFDQHDDDLTEETWISPDGREHASPPAYISSIDAAMSLVPEGHEWGCGHKDATGKPWAWVGRPEERRVDWNPMSIANASSPAAALASASLKAIAETMK